jgi:large subunit ribosomal protein L23
MSLFDRLTKKQAAPKTEKAKAEVAATTQGDVTPSATNASKKTAATPASLILKKPHVSEKAAYLADRGIYVFDVPLSANKLAIRKAVETQYKVNVVSVRTQRGIGKAVTRGRIRGRRSAWKKALVELKSGQKLSLTEGV